MRILIDGAEAASSAVGAGQSEVTAPVSRAKGEAFQVEVLFEAQQKWSPEGDDRDLALMLIEMRVESMTAEDPKPIYVAKRLADAERLEAVFKKAGIGYLVEPDTFQGGVIFRSTRVGAFFYVAPELWERASAVMTENGFTPLKP